MSLEREVLVFRGERHLAREVSSSEEAGRGAGILNLEGGGDRGLEGDENFVFGLVKLLSGDGESAVADINTAVSGEEYQGEDEHGTHMEDRIP